MMNEPEKADDRGDESLANVPPMPMEPDRATRVGNLALGAVMLTAAGAGAFLLIAGTMTPCIGATRSSRLEWEKRQQEIEQAERESEARSPCTINFGDGGDDASGDTETRNSTS